MVTGQVVVVDSSRHRSVAVVVPGNEVTDDCVAICYYVLLLVGHLVASCRC